MKDISAYNSEFETNTEEFGTPVAAKYFPCTDPLACDLPKLQLANLDPATGYDIRLKVEYNFTEVKFRDIMITEVREADNMNGFTLGI